MTYYCVLWMPTVIHKCFEPLNENLSSEVFEISDNIKNLIDGDRKIYCQLTLFQNKNIIVDIFDEQQVGHKIDDLCLTLNFDGCSHNGLFKYRCMVDDEKGNALLGVGEGLELGFPCDIYNKIKEFYHKHNFHKIDDGDSMIKAFISNVDINIYSQDNEALKHYLAQYEYKFHNSLYFVQQQYDLLVKRGWLKNFTMLMFGRGKHHSFYRLATRMKGDKAYYNSLLYSCYNTISDLSPIKHVGGLTDDAKKARRKIFNVVNSIECLNVMEEKINNSFSIQTSVISFWVAIVAILLSVLFYFLSMNNDGSNNTMMLMILDIWSKINTF